MCLYWLGFVLVLACGCSAIATPASAERNCAELDPAQFQRPSAERIAAARAALRAGDGLVGEFTPYSTEASLSRAELRKLSTNLDRKVRSAREERRLPRAQLEPARAVLLVGVRADGSVEEISVLESSGWIVVDRVIVEALQDARFRPANLDACSVSYWFALPLTLALD